MDVSMNYSLPPICFIAFIFALPTTMLFIILVIMPYKRLWSLLRDLTLMVALLAIIPIVTLHVFLPLVILALWTAFGAALLALLVSASRIAVDLVVYGMLLWAGYGVLWDADLWASPLWDCYTGDMELYREPNMSAFEREMRPVGCR